MSCPPGCHQAPHRTNSILAWGRENAFAKRGIITLAVIHLSGFPGEVFYYDFSAPSPAVGLGLLTHKGPIHVPGGHSQPLHLPASENAASAPHPSVSGPRSPRRPGLGAESRGHPIPGLVEARGPGVH